MTKKIILFECSAPLQISLTADFYEGNAPTGIVFNKKTSGNKFRKTDVKWEDGNPKPIKNYETADLSYIDCLGNSKDLSVEWRTRGNSRSVYPIPPVMVKFKKK